MKNILLIIYTLIIFYCLNKPICVSAQLRKFPEIYPSLPFNISQVADQGNSKCSLWKGIYKKTKNDKSGVIWTNAIVESHQFQKYFLPDGKMDMITTYNSYGDKVQRMEFFYKQGFLSAIETLNYDSLQKSHLDHAYHYFYKADSVPFQRVKMFGHPNKKLRLLDELTFDTLNHLIRIKRTAVGFSPYMDSLAGMESGEKILTLTEYEDSTVSIRKYKNLHNILSDKKSFYNYEGNIERTEIRNSKGDLTEIIDYEYTNGKLSKKVYSCIDKITKPILVPENQVKKKKSKQINRKSTKEDVPEIESKPKYYKVEFYTYNTDGLLETHIIEENLIQTVFEYTFFVD